MVKLLMFPMVLMLLQINVKVSEIDNDSKTFGMNLAADLLGTMLQDTKVNNSKEYK